MMDKPGNAGRQTSTAGFPPKSSGQAYVIPQKRKRPDEDVDMDEWFPHDLEKRRQDLVAVLEGSNELDERMSQYPHNRVREYWKAHRSAVRQLRDLVKGLFDQIRDLREEIASQKSLASKPEDTQLPHDLKQTVHTNLVTIINQLPEEVKKLKSDPPNINYKNKKRVSELEGQLAAKDVQLRGRIEEIDDFHEKNLKYQLKLDSSDMNRVNTLQDQLAEKDAQLRGMNAEIDGLHEQNTDLELQVQIRNDQIAKVASEFKESARTNEQQGILVQRLQATVERQADELQHLRAKDQQLVNDNAALRAENEKPLKALTQEILNELKASITSAVSKQ
ncbi:hypothetical protein PG988_009242 [Apiospora saccharicola]